MAISKPLKHRVIPRSYYNAVLAGAWIYGAVIAAVFVTDFKSESWQKHRGLLSTIAGFIFPLFVITCMYINMYRKVTLFNMRRRCYSLKSFHKRENRERKIAKILLIITILFNLSWLPFFTMSLLFIFCPLKCLLQGKKLMHLLDFVKLLHYGNSAINPVVYTFHSLKMRSTLIRIVAPCHILTPVAPVAREFPLSFPCPLACRFCP